MRGLWNGYEIMKLSQLDRLPSGWPIFHIKYKVQGEFCGFALDVLYGRGRVRCLLNGRVRRALYRSSEVEVFLAPGLPIDYRDIINLLARMKALQILKAN